MNVVGVAAANWSGVTHIASTGALTRLRARPKPRSLRRRDPVRVPRHHQQIDVAPGPGGAAGVRPEQDDALRIDAQLLDGGDVSLDELSDCIPAARGRVMAMARKRWSVNERAAGGGRWQQMPGWIAACAIAAPGAAAAEIQAALGAGGAASEWRGDGAVYLFVKVGYRGWDVVAPISRSRLGMRLWTSGPPPCSRSAPRCGGESDRCGRTCGSGHCDGVEGGLGFDLPLRRWKKVELYLAAEAFAAWRTWSSGPAAYWGRRAGRGRELTRYEENPASSRARAGVRGPCPRRLRRGAQPRARQAVPLGSLPALPCQRRPRSARRAQRDHLTTTLRRSSVRPLRPRRGTIRCRPVPTIHRSPSG
jgi:hypothetical protein